MADTGGAGGVSTAPAQTTTKEADKQQTDDMAVLEQRKKESQQRVEQAKQIATTANAQAQANQTQGTAQVQQGGMQTAMGAGMMAAGAGLAYGGKAMVAAGTAASAVTAGAGAGQIAMGTAMITSGVGMAGQGVTQMAQGAMATSQGTEKLAQAVNDKVISKEQGSIANKEMQRSVVYEAKLRMQEGVKQELEQKFGQTLSPEEFAALKEKMKQGMDKSFERAGDSLKNGGILTMEGQKDASGNELDTMYFKKNEDGSISQIEVKKDANGNPILGEQGELQFDKELEKLPDLKDISPDDPRYNLVGQVTLDFMVADEMKKTIIGDPENGIPPLARIQLNEDGTVSKGTYDINNLRQMGEFADIVKAANQEPPPLKLFETTDPETGKTEQYLQQWDWSKWDPKSDPNDPNNPAAIGKKVSLTELSGGEYDRNDPESVKQAKERAAAAFKELGLAEGDARYNLLAPLVENGFDNDTLNSLGAAGPSGINRAQDYVASRFGRGSSGDNDQSQSTSGSSIADRTRARLSTTAS